MCSYRECFNEAKSCVGGEADDRIANLISSSNSDLLRVLVVDDSSAIQKLMKKWLESNGCVVRIAENGKVGLALLKEQCFDITFMDFLMVSTFGRFRVSRNSNAIFCNY